MFRAGDVDRFVNTAVTRNYVCVANDFRELCAGVPAGQTRPGYAISSGGEGNPGPLARFRSVVATYMASAGKALKDRSDIYGNGEVKVGSIGCVKAVAPTTGCDPGQPMQVNLTYISSGDIGLANMRTSFAVEVQRVAASGAYRPDGIGQSVPPNAVLNALERPARLQDGSMRVIIWYPWTP
jgi:hypothetical protein